MCSNLYGDHEEALLEHQVLATFEDLRLIDSCITQLKAQGPSRTCNESKEEEEGFRAQREQLNRFQ